MGVARFELDGQLYPILVVGEVPDARFAVEVVAATATAGSGSGAEE